MKALLLPPASGQSHYIASPSVELAEMRRELLQSAPLACDESPQLFTRNRMAEADLEYGVGLSWQFIKLLPLTEAARL